MSEVFILGAGFSKAISPQMPLTRELTNEVLTHFAHKKQISADVMLMLEEDFEKALTYLASDNPWLRESENLRNRALYLDLTHFIRAIIHNKSKGMEVWGNIANAPAWLKGLINYWHNNRCTVITLNYDTLIERVASSTYPAGLSAGIDTRQLYPIDLTPAGQRVAILLGADAIETFRLFKLHGSINWFYSGRSQFYGETLYFVPCENGVDGSFDALAGQDPEKLHWEHVGDKTALIIPPILDKNVFFQHESLRSMWFQASEGIRNAKKIVCMGYSMPTGDLTMAQFLKSSAPKDGIPFHLVNLSSMTEHFEKVIGKGFYNFQQERENAECIRDYVLKHCVTNEGDINKIIGESV